MRGKDFLTIKDFTTDELQPPARPGRVTSRPTRTSSPIR